MSLRSILSSLHARQGTLVVGTLITLVFNGAAVGLYGIGCVLSARALGPNDWGTALWYITGTTIIALFADVAGVFYANSYFVARGEDLHEGASTRGSVLVYGLLLGLLVGSIVTVASPVRHAIFQGLDTWQWCALIASNITGLSVVNQARGVLLGDRNFIALGVLTLLKSGGFGVAAVVLVYLLHLHSAQHVAVAHLLSTLAALALGVAYLARGGIGTPRIAYLLRCARIGWRGASGNLLSYLSQRAGQYLVKMVLSPAALGLFGVAISLGDVLTQVPQMVGLVLFPSAARAKDRAAADGRAVRLALGTVLMAVLLMLPFLFAARPLVLLLFGPAYVGAIPVLQAYVPAIALLSGLLIVNQHIAGTGYPIAQVLIQGFVLVLTVIANLLLLPHWGAVGASLAAVATYGAWLALDLAYLRVVARRRNSSLAPAS
jgi:O-antigen/teichoic acid export membrane protein